MKIKKIKSKESKNYQQAIDWLYQGEDFLQSKPGLAISFYKKAIELDPNIDIVYLKKGQAHFKLSEYIQAIECYDKVLLLNPKMSEAYNYKGIVYYKMNKEDEALDSFQNAIKLNPLYKSPYQNIGQIFLDQKRYQEAVYYFNKALEFDEKDAEVQFAVGRCLCELKQWNDCFIALDDAIDLTGSQEYAQTKSEYQDLKKLSEVYNNIKYQKMMGSWSEETQNDKPDQNYYEEQLEANFGKYQKLILYPHIILFTLLIGVYIFKQSGIVKQVIIGLLLAIITNLILVQL